MVPQLLTLTGENEKVYYDFRNRGLTPGDDFIGSEPVPEALRRAMSPGTTAPREALPPSPMVDVSPISITEGRMPALVRSPSESAISTMQQFNAASVLPAVAGIAVIGLVVYAVMKKKR